MGGVAPFNRVTNQKENIEQQAVFGQLSWRPVYDWELTVGARFNHEERDTDDFADNNGAISDLSASESFDQFIPSFTIAHDLNDATRIGASYSRGFQAGGTAFAVFQAQATPYDEEFIDNYELFLRYQSLDGRLVVNGNLFYFDWSDQQVTTTLPGGVPGFDNAVVNAGKSEVTGAELELEWRATERVSLFTSVGIVDSEFKTFVVNGVDLAGRSLPQSPDLTATLGGRYASERGLFAAATFSYTDDSYSRIEAPEVTRTRERNLLSGRLGYQRDGWQAYVWGTNLLDDEYELFLQDGSAFGVPGSGAYGSVGATRTLGVGVQLDW
jgi:outer membrane receptor protein involved in Fe transport